MSDPTGPAGAAVRFLPGWREAWLGPVRAGGTLQVVYDGERAAECFGGHEREARLKVVVHALFAPGGEQLEARLEGGVATLAVPDGARGLSLWFHATSGDGSTSWDTRFGQNYDHPVQAS